MQQMSEENKDRIIQDFATNLIRLGNECRDHALENARLNAEVDQLVHKVNYWRIEAETDNARWLRCLEDKERLTKAGDNLVYVASEHPVSEPFVKAWFAAKEGKQS
jgi:hypothetical protein